MGVSPSGHFSVDYITLIPYEHFCEQMGDRRLANNFSGSECGTNEDIFFPDAEGSLLHTNEWKEEKRNISIVTRCVEL